MIRKTIAAAVLFLAIQPGQASSKTLVYRYNYSSREPFSQQVIYTQLDPVFPGFNVPGATLRSATFFTDGYYLSNQDWDITDHPFTHTVAQSIVSFHVDYASDVYVNNNQKAYMYIDNSHVLPNDGLTGSYHYNYDLRTAHIETDPIELMALSAVSEFHNFVDLFFSTFVEEEYYMFPKEDFSRSNKLRLGIGVIYDFSVPEPELWTMMIAGFGLIGLFMRGRMSAVA